jgi:hypothetical protein
MYIYIYIYIYITGTRHLIALSVLRSPSTVRANPLPSPLSTDGLALRSPISLGSAGMYSLDVVSSREAAESRGDWMRKKILERISLYTQCPFIRLNTNICA